MNESEWTELQQLWKSAPAPAEPRRHRAAVDSRAVATAGSRLEVIIEAVIAVAGLIAGVLMIVRGGSFLVIAASRPSCSSPRLRAVGVGAQAHRRAPTTRSARRRRGEAARVRACAARRGHDLGDRRPAWCSRQSWHWPAGC